MYSEFSGSQGIISNGLHRTRSVTSAQTGGTNEGRTEEHNRATTLSPFELTDLQFKCTDGVVVRAHKLVLASRCPYYHRRFLEGRTEMEVRMHFVYPYHASSHCCNAMLQFFYLGHISELDDGNNRLEDYLPLISSLLALAMDPKKDGLGGLLQYLHGLLRTKRSSSATEAARRLRIGWERKSQEVVDLALSDLASLPFAPACFKEACIEPELLVVVLRDVPLPAPEMQVCRAVSLWAREYYFDLDRDDSSMDPIQVDAEILDLLDTSCLSQGDIQQELAALCIFPSDKVREVKKKLLLGELSGVPRQNEKRGQDMTMGDTRIVSDSETLGFHSVDIGSRHLSGHPLHDLSPKAGSDGGTDALSTLVEAGTAPVF